MKTTTYAEPRWLWVVTGSWSRATSHREARSGGAERDGVRVCSAGLGGLGDSRVLPEQRGERSQLRLRSWLESVLGERAMCAARLRKTARSSVGLTVRSRACWWSRMPWPCGPAEPRTSCARIRPRSRPKRSGQ